MRPERPGCECWINRAGSAPRVWRPRGRYARYGDRPHEISPVDLHVGIPNRVMTRPRQGGGLVIRAPWKIRCFFKNTVQRSTGLEQTDIDAALGVCLDCGFFGQSSARCRPTNPLWRHKKPQRSELTAVEWRLDVQSSLCVSWFGSGHSAIRIPASYSGDFLFVGRVGVSALP